MKKNKYNIGFLFFPPAKTKDYYKPLTEDIETPLHEEEGDLIRYADILTDGTTAETDLIRQEERQRLKKAIEKLSAREQTIIGQIYGIGQKKVPQTQIAQQLGITPMAPEHRSIITLSSPYLHL